jgi:hypothetical protein
LETYVNRQPGAPVMQKVAMLFVLNLFRLGLHLDEKENDGIAED